MKVLGLDDREYNIRLEKYKVLRNDSVKKSSPHNRARMLLRGRFSGAQIFEEVKIEGIVCNQKRTNLYLDFFIPERMVVIEVHGQQHYEYNKFFHKGRADFLRSLNRDEAKEEWCKINSFKLIVLKHSDTDDEWGEQIANR